MELPKSPQRKPYVFKVQPGRYAWCSCGMSSKQPYCDGSHKGTEYRPLIETVEEERLVAWCGCKHTGKAPFCDGSHSNMPK